MSGWQKQVDFGARGRMGLPKLLPENTDGEVWWRSEV